MQRMRMICVAGLFLVVLGLGGCAEIADEKGKQGVQSVRMNDLKHIRGKCSVVKYRQMQSVCIIH